MGLVSFFLIGVYIGIMSGIMSFFINFIIVFIFCNVRLRFEKKKEFKFNIVDEEVEVGKDFDQKSIKSVNDEIIDEKIDEQKVLDREGIEVSLMREKLELNFDFVEFELKQQEGFLESGDDKKRVMS